MPRLARLSGLVLAATLGLAGTLAGQGRTGDSAFGPNPVAARVEGQIKDAAGRPLSKTLLEVAHDVPPGPGGAQPTVTTRSSSDGHFEFPELALGTHTLRLVDDLGPRGWSTIVRVTKPGTFDQGVIQLPPAAMLRGQVTTRHQGVLVAAAGATVELRAGSLPVGPPLLTLATDDNGRFEVDRLAAGPYTVCAYSPTHRDVFRLVELRADPARPHVNKVELRLEEGRVLRGIVVDDSGCTVAGARLTVGSHPLALRPIERRSEYDGTFEMPGVGTLLDGLEVCADGYETTTVPVAKLLLGTPLRVVLKRREAARARIRTLLAIDLPKIPPNDGSRARTGRIIGWLENVRDLSHFRLFVSLQDGTAHHRYRVPVSAEGRFVFEHAKAGRHRVVLHRRDGASTYGRSPPPPSPRPILEGQTPFLSALQTVEVRPGGSARVKIRRPPTTFVEGVVRAGGEPVPGAWVFAINTALRRVDRIQSTLGHRGSVPFEVGPRVRTDARGHYRIEIGGPGKWRLHARYPGSPDTGDGANLIVERPVSQNLDLELGATEVRGQLHLPAAADGDLSVYLVPPELSHLEVFGDCRTVMPFLHSVDRAATGDRPVRFPHLRPGLWSLRVGTLDCHLVRLLDVPASGVLDLGLITQPSDKVAIELDLLLPRIETSGQAFVILRRVVGEQRAWIGKFPLTESSGTTARPSDSGPSIRRGLFAAHAEVRPGRYEVELANVTDSVPRILCELRSTATLEVQPDGTVHPTPVVLPKPRRDPPGS